MVTKKSSKSLNNNKEILIVLSPLLVVILVALVSLLYVSGTFSVSNDVYDTSYVKSMVNSDSSLSGQAISGLVKENSDDDLFCSELEILYEIQNKPLDYEFHSLC